MLKRTSAGLLLGTSIAALAGLSAATPAFAQDAAPAAAAPAAAAAEDSTAASSDIVVTARRRSEKLIDVPAAISVVTTEMMATKGIQAPTDLIHSVPSLQQSSSGFGNSTPHFVIRGQRQQLEFIQSDQSVGIYVDEVAVPRQQGLNAGLFDMASVQVLKGPQGTLFGKNQTAGAILFTSQAPKADFGGFVSATLGNYFARKVEGAINIPISESLQIRAAGLINRREGYMYNLTDNRGYNDIHTDGWRVSARFAPSEVPIENTLIIAGATENEIGAMPTQPAQFLGLPGVGSATLLSAFGYPALYNTFASNAIQSQSRSYGKFQTSGVSQFQLPNGNNVEINTFSVTNKTEFHVSDDMTVRNIFGYRYLRSFQSANIGGWAGFLLKPGTTAASATLDPYGSLYTPIPDPINAPNTPAPAENIVCGPQSGVNCILAGAFNSMNYTKQRQISNELSVLGKAFDGSLDYIIGGYYFREHGDGVTSNFVPFSVASSRRLAQGNPANESTAVFGQVTYRPTATLSLTGGLRQTWDRREQNLRTATPTQVQLRYDRPILADGVNANCSLTGNADYPVTNTPTGCLISASHNFKKLTYTASIDWKPMPDTLLYAITRKGYRSGGFNQSVTAAVNVVETFRPETVTDIEIGFKGNWRWDNGMAAGLNIAAYRDKYKDIQRGATTIVGSRTITINAANATIKGLEVEARFEPTPWLELSGYYSLIDAKFQNFVIPDNGLFRDAGSYSQAKFSGVPTDSGGATITLHTELPNDMGRIAASMDYYGQTGTWLQDNNTSKDLTDSAGNVITPGAVILADYAPGYWLLGANLSWTNFMGRPVDLNFNVRNLNNKVYYTGGVDGSTSGIGTVSYFVGEPRLYTFNLKYRF